MTARLTKDSLDIGIVTTNIDESLSFYRDVLGLAYSGPAPIPGGTMHRLEVGTSSLKLVVTDRAPRAVAAPGGLAGSTGYRYCTLTVGNLEEVLAAVNAAGRTVKFGPTELPTGAQIAMVEDPDGNWVELLSPPSTDGNAE
jgi:catechol 2,3-dioxygenase-like lactoylglutathione lyase family enzyme